MTGPIDRTSPGYVYGSALGTLQRNMTRLAQQVLVGFEEAMTPTEALTPEQLEARRERTLAHRHARRIEAERQRGRQFVRAYAASARHELGLPR